MSSISRVYHVLATPLMERMALRLAKYHPARFIYHETEWDTFPDGTDSITLGGYKPSWTLRDQHVLFLASFHNNGVIVTQLHAIISLLQSFIDTLTIFLPFYPFGTNERVNNEGQIATASTMATLLSCLPSCGRPSRLMIYDLHTLQNRFYLSQNCVASLCTAIPLLKKRLLQLRNDHRIDCICFPDDGAAKRFSTFFIDPEEDEESYSLVICGKRRIGDSRVIYVQDGDPSDKNVLIVDDLIQTGGTVLECANEMRKRHAKRVCAYVTHAIFPNQSWKHFLHENNTLLDRFYVTNTNPIAVNQLPKGDIFEVIDILPQLVDDL
eukprot:Lankesteria_metandrocarpae@DN3119_c1_g1_i1.p1